MDARNFHDRLASIVTAVLGMLLAWGLWQAYGEWLFGLVNADVR